MLFYFKYAFDFLKKALLVIIIYLAVMGLFAHFINKDKPAVSQNLINRNRKEIYSVINNPELNKNNKGKTAVAIFRTVMCSIIGEGCTNNPYDGDKNYSNSLLGYMSNLITVPFSHPPASITYWAYDTLQNAGFIPQTYAAEGIGFASIKPFMNLWKIFRDIAYLLLVVFLIAIGFMIMFRMKISQQTVISVENALPRIVIALILITFSFPIAGLMIDIMYAAILLIIAILGNKGNYFDIAKFQNTYLSAGFDKILMGLLPNGLFTSLWSISTAIISLLPVILNQILRIITGGVLTVLSLHVIAPLIYSWLENIGRVGTSAVPVGSEVTESLSLGIKIPVGIFLGIVFFLAGYAGLAVIFFILILATVVLMFFRIFFMLFATYIRIFLMIVFSPIILLFEALPGKKAFGWWFKNLFMEIMTYPIVVVIFVLSYLIMNTLPATTNVWRPPFLTELQAEPFIIMLAMGIVFLVPDLVKLLKDLMGIKPLPISIGLGTYFAGAGTFIGGTEKSLGTLTSMTQMPVIGPAIMKRLQSEKGTGLLSKILVKPLSTQIAEGIAASNKK